MGVYVISGATTGIGAATAKLFLEQGHKVVNIDIVDGDITADLVDKAQRKEAIDRLVAMFPEGIDFFFANAGVGPTEAPDRIVSLNYFAVKEMCEAFYPLLLKKKGSIVVNSSNSANLPGHNYDLIAAMCDENDEAKAVEMAKTLEGPAKQQAYQGSKFAVARWARRRSASWAARGVRMNVVCPGNTNTPLMVKGVNDPNFAAGMKSYPLPVGYTRGVNYLEADQIARVVAFMASPLADCLSGAVLYADGGCDAMLRSERF